MKFHLISIGGAVMHNIALALQQNGHEVSGSDDEIFEPSRTRLQQAGLFPTSMGWHPENITVDIDHILLGMHARKDNPELLRSVELGLSVLSFPEFVYEQSKNKKRIVIGGSHGKTTTTAMIMHALRELKIDFDYLVGSQLEGFDTMVRFSNAEIMVIEGDEYLTSAMDMRPKFHWYKPHVAVLTGIAWDHINVFPTFEEYLEQFRIFCRDLDTGSVLYYFTGDENLQSVIRHSPARCIPYDKLPYSVSPDGITVNHEGVPYRFNVFGEHNFQNLQAAFLVCTGLGLESAAVIRALSTFKGTARRLETVYRGEELVIIRDFAHSPSKAKASVSAVREQYPGKPLLAVFELHTFSSLNLHFIPHYRDTLAPADHAIVYYDPAVILHKKLPEITPSFVESSFGNVEVIRDRKKLESRIRELRSDGTVLLLMSSGNFSGMEISDLTG